MSRKSSGNGNSGRLDGNRIPAYTLSGQHVFLDGVNLSASFQGGPVCPVHVQIRLAEPGSSPNTNDV
jgi:hypothetical protein